MKGRREERYFDSHREEEKENIKMPAGVMQRLHSLHKPARLNQLSKQKGFHV
jgi:hypothetical protein